MADIELVVIDADTKLRDFKDRLRWNDARMGANGE
jgi:L-arabinose isomerase